MSHRGATITIQIRGRLPSAGRTVGPSRSALVSSSLSLRTLISSNLSLHTTLPPFLPPQTLGLKGPVQFMKFIHELQLLVLGRMVA